MNKYHFLCIICIIIFSPIYSQKKVESFADIMLKKAPNPNSDKILRIRTEFMDGFEIKWVDRRNKYDKKRYLLIGPLIEKNISIDYQNDTIYFLEELSLLGKVTYYIKNRTGSMAFNFYGPGFNRYDTGLWDDLVIDALLRWDPEYITELVLEHGGYKDDGSWYRATKILLNDNRLISRETIEFDGLGDPEYRRISELMNQQESRAK